MAVKLESWSFIGLRAFRNDSVPATHFRERSHGNWHRVGTRNLWWFSGWGSFHRTGFCTEGWEPNSNAVKLLKSVVSAKP